MKKLLTAAVFLAIFTTGAANAATMFDFSYIFADSSAITGSLSGDLSGTLINNISNVQVSFNGTAFSGPLSVAGWDTSLLTWNTAPVVSTIASQNNFIFADSNVPTDFGASNYFFFTNDATNGQAVFATNLNTGDIAYDSPSSGGTWSIAAVPLPATFPLLMSGLGLLGMASRRRLQG
jgi:hypothetical protein